MRAILGACAIGLCVLMGALPAAALPTGSSDVTICVGTDHYETMMLGETLRFDYWFETTAAPGSFGPGQAFDVMVVQSSGDWSFLGQVDSFYSDSDWRSAVLDVPAYLQGCSQRLVFHVNDFAPDTDPVVYLRDLRSGPAGAVPEPMSALLLGTGLAGAAGAGLRKKRTV